MSLVLKQRAETSSVSKSKRSSPGHQIYALSGTAKRMATALRNVFRSDQAKDEQHNQQNQSNSAKNKDFNSKVNRFCDFLFSYNLLDINSNCSLK